MEERGRAELIVVAGGTTAAGARGARQVVSRVLDEEPGTVAVHHDLREVGHGVVIRTLYSDGQARRTVLELAHGCVSCTLREDVLPLLRRLAERADVSRIVLHLDAALEPEQVCWAIAHVVIEGASVTDAIELRGVITVLDIGSWLTDLSSDADVADSGLAPLPDDDRTLAQLVIGQAEFADLIVYTGTAGSPQQERTDAVLARLTPLAPRLTLAELDRRVLLEQLPPFARRGRPDDPHGPLLRGEPPTRADGTVVLTSFTARRPFHPERLHRAVDVLLFGVVRTRGRVWLATRPDVALWLETAGGGLQIGYAGDWLAAAHTEWEGVHPERQVLAALRWHERWGDRAQELLILLDGADPDDIAATLGEALLTDLEIAAGEESWRHYPDPFGWWHTDPCDEISPRSTSSGRPAGGRDDERL